MAQRTHGLHAVLSIPGVYDLFLRAIGQKRSRAEFVERYLRPFENIRIMDIGCGTARILDYLPASTKYVGLDVSDVYIEAARTRYGTRGTFIQGNLGSLAQYTDQKFDLVLATGLLHHLDDEDARALFGAAENLLDTGGRCLTVDPSIVPDQPVIARILARLDRGLNVRHPRDYEALAEGLFSKVETKLRHDRLRIPYTHCIMQCYL